MKDLRPRPALDELERLEGPDDPEEIEEIDTPGALQGRERLAELDDRYEGETLRCVLGSTAWRGPGEPPESLRLLSVLGSIVVDYRDADVPLGVTKVDCDVYLGSVEIFVPEGVDVELSGSLLLGSVETRGGSGRVGWGRRARQWLTGEEPDLEAELERPLLSIRCTGALGSVEVKLP